MSKIKDENSIAIIGMACWYPGAQNLIEFWENVLAKRRQFRRMLDARLPLADYYSPDKTKPDLTYGTKASFIEGFEYDWATNRFPKSAFESTDLSHWLALDVAIKALQDAGLTRQNIPLSKTGVIVGNSLTGETSRAENLRTRWPYVRKVLRASGMKKGFSESQLNEFIEATEQIYKSIFPPITEDSLAGSLANTIAGRICNYFNVDGGGFTVDGACSSSLLAVANAATSLATKDLDLAIVGGVDISLDNVELIGFAKVGALTETDIKVYDRDGKGFIPGEGSGFVILKRLPDAIRDNNRIYALLKGWGISSDGNGGLTAPKASGQAKALERAYQRAGYSVADCAFIEGHGTGTAVGDMRELEGINLAMNQLSPRQGRLVGMTSLKSIVGHTKAAAGIGAFIKATIGVNRRILPPTSGCENPNPVFKTNAQNLFPLKEGEIKSPSEIIRAGVSAMGFGGINCHVTVESFGPPSAELEPTIPEKALMASHSDSELFLFTQHTIANLKSQIAELLKDVPNISPSEMTDIAFDLSNRANSSAPYRGAILASNVSELTERLKELDLMLGSVPKEGQYTSNESHSVWLSNKTAKPKVGFLFPGQGSQKINMASELVDRFPWAQKFCNDANAWLQPNLQNNLTDFIYIPNHRAIDKEEAAEWTAKITQTAIAQPAICLASALWSKRLEEIGITCEVAAGHSLGELTALYYAGAYDDKTLIEIAGKRGMLMSATPSKAGSMVSLACDLSKAQAIVSELGEGIVVANINGPLQTVLSGTVECIEKAMQLASQQQINCIKLNVSNAFHSPLVASAAKDFKKYLSNIKEVSKFRVKIYSGIPDQHLIPNNNIAQYLSNQIISPVHFISIVESMMKECDFLIEVGPGNVLTGLVKNITDSKQAKCFPVESMARKESDLLRVAATFFVAGGNLRFDQLFKNRLHRPYTKFSERKFIVNPCERPFPSHLVDIKDVAPSNQVPMAPVMVTNVAANPVNVIQFPKAQENVQPPTQSQATTVKPQIPAPMAQPSRPQPSRPQPSNTQVAISKNEILETLSTTLEEVTGLTKSVFKPEMRLLDDLNLDSIKAAEVITKVTQAFSVQQAIDPIQFANATLFEISELVLKSNPMRVVSQSRSSTQTSPAPTLEYNEPVSVPQPQFIAAKANAPDDVVVPSVEPTPPSTAATVAGASKDDVKNALIQTLQSITGFSPDVFSMEMRLLDDLNLDSIKASEVISTLTQKYSLTQSMDPIQFANARLEEIINALAKLLPTNAGTPTEKGTPVPEAKKDSNSVYSVLLAAVAETSGYAESSLTPNMEFLKDLRIEEAQLSQIIRTTCSRLKVEPTLDLAPLAGSTIKKLSEILENIKTYQNDLAKKHEGTFKPTVVNQNPAEATSKLPMQKLGPAWVRNHTVNVVEKKRFEQQGPRTHRHIDQWENANTLIVLDSAVGITPFTEALSDACMAAGTNFKVQSFSEAVSKKNELPNYSHFIYVLPEQVDLSKTELERLDERIDRLTFFTSIPKPESQYRRFTSLVFVQFGDGSFNQKNVIQDYSLCSFNSMLQTIHIERPEMRVRNIEVSPALDAKFAAREILNEINTPDSFAIVGYTSSGTRLVPELKLSQPTTYESRELTWNSDDVLLVTGGAKGITAECALALARRHNIKVALVGSSPQTPSNTELLKNIEKFSAAKIRHNYYQCDVTDGKSVENLISQVQREMGPITAVLHGAGKNQPRRASTVKSAEARLEIAPKLIGAIHLINSLEPSNLKLFCAFTSIIGLMGVPGNAWYGFSNESLNNKLLQFGSKNPNTQVLTCAFGMWDEVGMAHKLGSAKKFSSSGLELIPVEEGVNRFLELVEKSPGCQQVMIAARIWQDSPLSRKSIDIQSFRFLEKIVSSTFEVETVARVHLKLDSDLYLRDHKYNGSYIFPTVFGLEAMAQVAAYTLGLESIDTLVIDNLDLNSAIIVDPKVGIEIEVYALVDELSSKTSAPRIKVGVRSSTSNFTRDAFSAYFQLNTPLTKNKVDDKTFASKNLNVNPITDIYGPLLFHGPAYQRMQDFYQLSSKSSKFSAIQKNSQDNQRSSFANTAHSLILGDPYLRDSLLQAVQAVLTKHTFLPVYCTHWEIRNVPVTDSNYNVDFKVGTFDGKKFSGEVSCFNQDGLPIDTLTGLQGVAVRPQPNNLTPEELLASTTNVLNLAPNANVPALKDFIKKLNATSTILLFDQIQGLSQMESSARHKAEIQFLAKQSENHPRLSGIDFTQVNWKPSGKPYFEVTGKEEQISFSHTGDLCVCALSNDLIGCDIEEVKKRSQEDWISLLGPQFSKVFNSLNQSIKDFNLVGSLVWSAREAAGKALDSKDFEFSNFSKNGPGAQFEVMSGTSKFSIYAELIEVLPGQRHVLAVAYHVSAELNKAAENNIAYSQSFCVHPDFNSAEGFRIRWPMTFKDASSAGKNLYFSKYFEWQGRAREIAIWPLLSEASNIFTKGEFGWVTNSSETKIFKSAEVGDIIEVRVSAGVPHGPSRSSVDAFYDWYRIDSHGGSELIAQSKMLTTWVKIIGHGLVEVASFPKAFEDFFASICKPPSSVAAVSQMSISNPIYEAPPGVGTGPILATHVFETGLEDSNLVGNVYFSNYSVWQGRTRDALLYRLYPELVSNTQENGEPFTTYAYIKHLREAMPFDQIQVTMRLHSFDQSQIKLYFEYNQFKDGKVGHKIAFAEHQLVWASNVRNSLEIKKLPEKLNYFLKMLINESEPKSKVSRAA